MEAYHGDNYGGISTPNIGETMTDDAIYMGEPIKRPEPWSGFDDEDVIGHTAFTPFEDKVVIGEGLAAATLKVEGDAVFTGKVVAENPKTKAGAKKPSLFSVIPTAALLHLGEVMRVGANKYGPFNWRETPVPAETYVDAMGRHMLSWQDGEDLDPESGRSHLAHIMASCAILIDAQENGMLRDDRPKAGRVGEMISNFQRIGKFNVDADT